MSETIGTTTLFTTSSFSASPTLEPTSTATTTFEISPTTYNPPSNKGGGLSVGVVLPVILAVVFVLFGVSVYPCLRIRRRRRRRLHHAKYPHDHKHPPSYKAAVPMAVGAAAGMTAVAVATANDGHPAEEIALDEDETAYGTSNGATVSNVTEAMDVTTSIAYAGAATDVFGMAGTAPASSANPMSSTLPDSSDDSFFCCFDDGDDFCGDGDCCGGCGDCSGCGDCGDCGACC
ncbi:hypothetical protein BGW42_006065 [Actinomortierella wolfii]|nr:hypothetical protein BGW42_006065 [Actinomortierella wolfii]